MKNETIVYAKYSNERTPKFRIRTDIVKDAAGNLMVRKCPMHREAERHISQIYDDFKMLEKKYRGTHLYFNHCEKEENALSFEYIEGISLNQEIDELLLNGKIKTAKQMIDQLVQAIMGTVDGIFEETEEFRTVFGSCPLSGCKAVCGSDIDLVFSNIIRKTKRNMNNQDLSADKDMEWHVIDYEWTYHFPIPVNYILYRILYFQASEDVRKLNLCEVYGIKEEEKEIYEKMEDAFMHYVYEGQVLISDSQIIKPKYIVNEKALKEKTKDCSIKIYYDYGEGLTEKNIDYFFYNDDKKISVDIPIGELVTGMRIDPMETCGIVHIKKLYAIENEAEYKPQKNINGELIHEDFYLFRTEDPWIHLIDLREHTSLVHLELEIDTLSKQTVEACFEKSIPKDESDETENELEMKTECTAGNKKWIKGYIDKWLK